MSGVPSAFMCVLVLVLVEVLVMPEGVVMVLDLLIVPEPLVMVLDLLMPAGLLIVLDFTVVRVAGVWTWWVVVFDELVLIRVVEAAGAGAVAGVWARATPLSKLRETRNPKMRFMIFEMKGEKMGFLRGSGPRSWLAM